MSQDPSLTEQATEQLLTIMRHAIGAVESIGAGRLDVDTELVRGYASEVVAGLVSDDKPTRAAALASLSCWLGPDVLPTDPAWRPTPLGMIAAAAGLDDDRWITLAQASKTLGLPPITVIRMVDRGEIGTRPASSTSGRQLSRSDVSEIARAQALRERV